MGITHPSWSVAVPCGAALGEAPLWDWRTGTLVWVDIRARVLFTWKPDGGRDPVRTPVDEPVTFAELTPDPRFLVIGCRSGVRRLDLATRHASPLLRPEPHRPGNRLNDAGVGPDGSLYFGSMDEAERERTGRFYHWSDHGVTRFGAPAIVTNGPTVDPLARLVYAADTADGVIYVHPLSDDGTPGRRHLFVRFGDREGKPDGLTVDSEGCLWVCHFGGGRVTRFDPDGRRMLAVALPTPEITKLAFGGPDLATAYVTSASVGIDRTVDRLAGHVFRFDPGVRGLPAEPCRIAA